MNAYLLDLVRHINANNPTEMNGCNRSAAIWPAAAESDLMDTFESQK